MFSASLHGIKTSLQPLALALSLGIPFPTLAAATPSPEQPPAIAQPASAIAAAQPPDVLLGPLFNDVQRAKLFPDQKTFADAVPNQDPAVILAAYTRQKSSPGFDLQRFVERHFTLPQEGEAYIPPAGQTLRQHIDGLWRVLTRTTRQVKAYDSLLPLPHSYVVPGGRFREIYYWDSYFTMLGLAESDNWELVQNMTDNFAYEIDRYGHIPNGNRTYYLSRSQPPFFSFMVELLAQHQGEKTYARYLPQLKKEYHYWMRGSVGLPTGQASDRVLRLDDGSVLNRYWDERNTPRTESYLEDITTAAQASGRPTAEVYRDLRAGAASGWDFSSRWLRDPHDLSTIHTTDIIPVDLNSLLFHLELTLARGAKAAGNQTEAAYFLRVADERKQAVNRYLWNQQDGYYSDYDWRRKAITQPITAAAVFPLYVGIAPRDRAAASGEAVRRQLLKEGGLTTTTLNTGQQWDAPNGWAPLQWVAVEGFNRYGQEALAQAIGTRFLDNVQKLYDAKHKLVEKYVVEGTGFGSGGGGGEYALQDGFGWTNGVTLKLMARYCTAVPACQRDAEPAAAR
ncbi:alpha,alpha-trehalase [Brenneria goodwinii]|uniref:Periplasmic trehalase n=1 Tax=Brenneria goodwinii TaxID=1109412 RepID=A0AAE8EN10_9GAMM|nr:alpha,alpha-trehalase TreA [Brenneria goodwinii]ATA23622.1 alpha,alpha-trehalase [Brenneria goodwinii]RLM22616.1 alpha,alpha-trehalase [Brenneria goodwinii]